MRILLVDDEELARLRLRRLLGEITDCVVIAEASNGQEALEKIHILEPDLVFLDVRMPILDGISVAKQLSSFEAPPSIVFCTAYDEYALEAFETLAQGYIVKPVELDQLRLVIEKSAKLTRLQSQSLDGSSQQESVERKHISAKTRRGLELIPIDNIYCFVADHKYVTVLHDHGESLIDDTLKELENEFHASFVRVHRNSLVAVSRIEALERNEAGAFHLRLKETDHRPVISRRHLADVRQLLGRL